MQAFFINPKDISLALGAAPKPQPAPGKLLVHVRAAGLNRGELLRHGLTKPGPAKIGGTEGAAGGCGAWLQATSGSSRARPSARQRKSP